MSGAVIATTMGQSHRLRPPCAAAIPPRIPPRVRPSTPTVPWTNPIWLVVNPSPPWSMGLIMNRLDIFTNRASGSLYRSMKRMAVAARGFRRKERNVCAKSLVNFLAEKGCVLWSVFGCGRVCVCQSVRMTKNVARVQRAMVQESGMFVVLFSIVPASIMMSPLPVMVAMR